MKKHSSYVWILVLTLLGIGMSCKKDSKETPTPITETFTSDNFVLKTSEGLVIAYFWAKWCTYCTQMTPAIEEIAIENKSNLVVGKVDFDKETALINQFNITSVPQLYVYKNGSLVEIIKGLRTKTELTNSIKKYLPKN